MTQARPYREKKKMPEVRRGNAGVSDGSAATRGIFLCQNTSIRGMKMGMSFFKQLRREFAGYNGKKLSQDLMAGLTVAAVALPLALAFGVSAGATAACGDRCGSRDLGAHRRILSDLGSDRRDGGHPRLADRRLRHAGHVRGDLSRRHHADHRGSAASRQSDRVRTGAGHHRLYIGHRGHHRARPDRQLFRHAF